MYHMLEFRRNWAGSRTEVSEFLTGDGGMQGGSIETVSKCCVFGEDQFSVVVCEKRECATETLGMKGLVVSGCVVCSE